jgi:hypothetical protein
VLYDKTSVAEELKWSADGNQSIGIGQYYLWSSTKFRTEHPVPSTMFGNAEFDLLKSDVPIALGAFTTESADGKLRLHHQSGRYHLCADIFIGTPKFHAAHVDRGVLVRYIESLFDIEITRTLDREKF